MICCVLLLLLLSTGPASTAIGSCPSTFVSTRDLRADRKACTAACNTAGYCCTKNTGGCEKLTCSAGCHIAWHTSDEAACVEECNKGNAAGCTFTATDGTQFQNCFGHEKCGCPAAGNGNDWGTANDCSASACAAGCRLAKDVKGHSFYGRKLTEAEIAVANSTQSTQEAALDVALTSLADHVSGKTALSNTKLSTKAATFLKHAALLKQGSAVLTKALDLVEAYEASSSGPLPFPFQRAVSNDGHDLSRAMLVVQQGLLDEVWNSGDQGRTSVVANCSRAVFEKRAWQTSTTYPGAAAPPADPTVVHTVKIWATVPKLWGAHVARNTEDARKPLGVYLSPGRIAKVTVPDTMVGKDFKVLVGGQTPDNSIKGEHKRMDRVTVKVPITAATTHVTSPLGGSLYVLVPYLADLGTQTVQVTGDVVPSPLFQMTRVRQMTNADWKAVRASPGPWADFETDKFMLTVPRSWIYTMEDPMMLMTTYDTTMDGVAEMFGFPISKRNRKVLYLMPDLHIEHPAYGTGYPQVNVNINIKALATPPASGYDGYNNHWFVRDPTGWPVCYHELGHSQQEQTGWFQYRGETEAIVNFVWAYLRHMKFGDHFNAAFKGSMSHSNYEPDDAAVHWMITPNFRAGNEMDHSHTELDEFRYQHRGYAKYADIARLFGWGAWTGYYSQRNNDHNTGVTEDKWRDGLDGVDARTLQFSVQTGCDITPLIHFWGIKPVNAMALAAKIKVKELGECLPVLCLLKRYRTLVPADNTAFNTFFEKIHTGRPIVASDDTRYGRGWYNVWRDTYGAAEGTAAVAQLDSVINTYFTNKDASCAGQITATSDVARPCKYSWLSEGSPTTFGCNGTTPGTTTTPTAPATAAHSTPSTTLIVPNTTAAAPTTLTSASTSTSTTPHPSTSTTTTQTPSTATSASASTSITPHPSTSSTPTPTRTLSPVTPSERSSTTTTPSPTSSATSNPTPFASAVWLVKMVVSLPMSLAAFTLDKQVAFKASLARAVSVSSEDVSIDKIESINRRRHLLAESIRIETTFQATGKVAADEMAASLTPDKINIELTKAGLPAASVLVSAKSQRASDIADSSPSVTTKVKATSDDLHPAIIGGTVAGSCVLLMAMTVCMWFRPCNPDPGAGLPGACYAEQYIVPTTRLVSDDLIFSNTTHDIQITPSHDRAREANDNTDCEEAGLASTEMANPHIISTGPIAENASMTDTCLELV